MFKVRTRNLSPDARAAADAEGVHDLGELDAARLTALLEVFRKLDPLQNAGTDAQIEITGPAGKFLVRTNRDRLLLYNARNSLEQAAELTADRLVAQVGEDVAAAGPAADAAPADLGGPEQRPWVRTLAYVMLAAGIALIGWAGYGALNPPSGDRPPTLTAITDANRLADIRQHLPGVYATGTDAGDAALVVDADGTLQFRELLSPTEWNETGDTYFIGQLGGKTCLGTRHFGGVIEVIDANTLAYEGETYRRTN